MSASDPSAPGLPLAGGGGASLPTTPGLALLDAGAASRVVVLNVSGEGDTEAYDTVTTTGLASMLGGEAVGTAVISDGAGDIDLTSADVSAMLACADDAAIRTAIGAAATVTTTRGDLIRRGASADERVALGASGYALRSDGTDPVWSALATAGVDASRPAASVATLGALYTSTDTGVRYVCESDGAGGARWAVQGARGQEGRDTTSVLLDGARADTSVTIVGSTLVSYALVFAMRSSPSAVQVLLTINPNTGTDGTQLDVGRDAGDRYLLGVYRYGFGTPQVYLTGATISGSPTTLHCIAVTLDGATVRYSLDGAAAATVSCGTGAATVGTASLRLGQSGSGSAAADAWMASAVAWSTAVSDSDLAIVSGAARAAGSTPGRIPAVSGATEIARWHAGWQRAGLATEPLLAGSLGGSLTWSAPPTLVVR